MKTLWKLLLTVACALFAVPFSNAQQQMTIGNFAKISERQVTFTLVEYTYKADVINSGPAARNVSAVGTSVSPNTIIISANLNFGDVAANSSKTSLNTFVFRQDRRFAFSWSNIQWSFTSTQNQAPVANAGPPQTVHVGDTVNLNGSGSTDPDGDPITYLWSFVSRPAGSTASLQNPTSVTPSFIVDKPGNYIVQLVVNDGSLDSAPSTVTISTINSAPVANAGPNQTKHVTETVQLDGSGSSDVDGDPLTYQWSFLQKPAGSTATLSDPTAIKPTFVIDKPGSYKLQLVVNDGSLSSAPSTVTISTVNTPPVANAGPNQTVHVGDTVHLNGSGSTDVDGDPLTYSWSLLSQPIGSTAVLSNPTSVTPSFVVDKAGSYVVQLIVNDGHVDSTPSTVTINTLNSPPVANAGPNQSVFVGSIVNLDGTASSDPDGDSLTYSWSLISKPAGSTATLTNPLTATPSFTVDKPGSYIAQLIVNDGQANSAPATVTITTKNSPPVANAGPDQTVPAGSLVQLDGTGSSDPDADPLTYKWSILSKPAGGTATLSSTSAAKPTFTADLIGSYVVQLIVNDGTTDSAPDTVQITATTVGAPQITKSFGAASIPLNGTTSVGFTINNPNTASSLSGIAFTDNLPPGMVVATPNNITGSCGGGTITAVSGSSVISLSGATLAPSTLCTFTVDIKGTTAGSKTNVVTVTSTNGGTGNTASANITVQTPDPPQITKSFGAASIPVNGTTSVGFTINNPNPANSLSGVSFTDTLPPGMIVATPNNITGSCGGGTITAVSGSSAISLSGATLAANALCTFSVDIKGTTAGSKTNTVTVTSTEGGQGNTSTATINVIVLNPPQITKSFGAASIPLNGTTSVGFTVNNPNTGNSLSGVSFTDTLPPGMIVATPNNITGSCGGGTITAVSGSSTISLSGATLAANASCTVSVNITGTTAGSKTNSVTVNSTEGGQGNTASATLKVIAPANITKAFGAASIPIHGSTSLTFTITNTNASDSLSGVSFTDIFPANMLVSTPNGLTGSCGGGTITATAGSVSVSLSGATLAANASCSFTVNITIDAIVGTSPQQITNTVAVNSTEGGQGNTASANISVFLPDPPHIVKAFGATDIPLNGSTSLSFTINNPNATTSLTGVGFNDTLVPGLVVATPSALTNSCGGTATAVDGSSSISLAGVTLAGNASCTVTLNITGTTGGTRNNTVSVNSTNGGTGNSSSATININGPFKLAFTVQPSNTVAGSPITPAVQVAVQDIFGNTITGVTNAITLNIANNPGSSTLSGTATVNAVNGVATFANLSLNKVGTGYTFNASSSGLTPATSTAFNITAGAANKLAFTGQPANTAAGANITPAVTVAVQDAFGNPTNSTASVTIAIANNPGGSTLSGTTTVNAVNGVATFGNLSLNQVGTGYTLGASSSGLTGATSAAFNITGANMTIATADPLVGVGRTINGSVTLGAPAPAGGVTINLSSGSPGIASIAPNQVTILQGGTVALFTVTGIAAGGPVTLTATATGFNPATTQINVTSAVISIGTAPPVAPSQSASLPVSLSSPAPPGGVTINFTVVDPTIASITSSVFVPAGQQVPAGNPQVTGIKIGTTQVNASAVGFAPDSRSVTVTVTATFNPTSVTVAANNSTNITLNISAPAPAGGITFNLTTDDPTAATAPPTATVAQGGTSVQIPITGVGANKSTTLRANSIGIAEATATITVNPAPGISLANLSIGKDLQAAVSINLGAAPSVPTDVTISAPAGVLLSKTGTDAGSSSLTFTGVTSTSAGTVFVYALSDTGTAQLTVTAAGYGNTTGGLVTMFPSGFIINTPGDTTTTTFSANTNIQITPARLNAALQFQANQALRPGVTASVSLTNDNTNAGVITISPLSFAGGDSSKNTAYDPMNAGVSHIALVTPAGFSTPANFTSITFTVNAPNITLGTLSIGKDLQAVFSATLGATPPVPTDVTISAPAGSNVLLSKTGTDAGSSSLTFTGVTTTTVGNVFVYALANTGTAQLTATATGYGNVNGGLISMFPSGFIINTPGDTTTTTFSANTNIQITPARLNVALQFQANQALRPGVTASVSLTNDNTNAGVITISPLSFAGGDSSKNTAYDPMNAGVSHIALVTPAGFSTPTNFTGITFTVNAPNITLGTLSIGKDLQTAISASLGATPPVPTDVTISAPAGSNVLLSKTGTDAGASSITFTGVTTTTVGNVFVYALSDTGTAQLTATATGYGNVTGGLISMFPSGFIINTPGDTTTTTFSANTNIQITSARLNAALQFQTNQALRPGVTASVSLTNDNTNAGVITISPLSFTGPDSTKSTAYDPVAAGVSHISVVAPAGFSASSTFSTITFTVRAPNINVAPSVTVGKDLQISMSVSLESAPPNPVDVTITTPVGSPAVLSTSATAAGSNSVTFTGVTSTTVMTVFIQGLATGSTQLRAQAAGYNDGVTNITVNPSGFIINSPGNFTTSVGAANTSVQINSALLNPTTLAFVTTQPIRGGLTNVSVSVTSSNTTAGTITVSPVIFNGTDSSLSTAFHPGTTHGVTSQINVVQPPGFATPNNFTQITATVN